MTTVLLVDDEHLVRAGLRMILETAPDLSVIGEAADGQAALDAVRRDRPDVVLMDLHMPRLDGTGATAAIHALDEPPAVVVLTTFDTDDDVFGALAAGASGFLLKDTPPHDLVEAVRRAATGDAMLSPAVVPRVLERVATHERSRSRADALARLDALTAREREVAVEIGRGRSNGEIGALLDLREASVKSHVTHLFEKLGVTNRVQVAILTLRAGLVD